MSGNAIPSTFIRTFVIAGPRGDVKESAAYGHQLGTGISAIPLGTLIKGSPWKLKVTWVVEIRPEISGYVAIDHAVDEYGMGATVEEAVKDLLSSLADYRAWLEKRRGRLADQEREALCLLQMILEKQ